MRGKYVVIDFESFYSTKAGYTLKKMTPPEYILDPRFECTGASIIEGDNGNPFWLDGISLKNYFRELRARQRAGEPLIAVSHNALFDMCLLAWRFGLVPDMMLCTMAMSQALIYPRLGYVSLAKVAKFLGLKDKGDTIGKVDGMTAAQIKAAGLWSRYTTYALDDAIICRQIFQKLRNQLPREEFRTMNMVLRMAVKPKLLLNVDKLHEHLAFVRAQKAQLLASAGLEFNDMGKVPALMSNEKFAGLLRELGVEPPMKTSPTTGLPTYAFSKADQGMADLEEHDDPEVQTLVAARLGFKSTLEETRTERLIRIASCGWPHAGGAPTRLAPMPIKYAGAHTHRLSGDWKINVQNFPRGGRLRDSLEAPPGHVVITCDASQIEARLAAWLAAIIRGEHSELVQLFAEGADVYSAFATKHIYHRLITKADTKERFVGKQAILGLGFGMGWARYLIQVKKDSRLQLKVVIELSPEQSKEIVNGYRFGIAPAVPHAWRTLQNAIPLLQHNSGFQFGPMTFGKEEVTGPTGLKLFYPDVRQVPGDKGMEWLFHSGRMDKRLFGGKFYENIIQHLARCCNIETALKVEKQFGVELALQAHDELVYVVPGGIEYYMDAGKKKYNLTGFAAEFAPALQSIMSERPSWGATLPLAAEVGAGLSYGDAK